MTTILLLLATVFIGYALYVIFTSKGGVFYAQEPDYMASKSPDSQSKSEQVPAELSEEHSETEAEVSEEPEREAPPREEKPSDDEVSQPEPARITGFRHPETGETGSNPTNYRFAKKWIKEAMVTEGLLDRVYKNSELKGPTEKKVKEALSSFRQLDKYYDQE